MSAAEGTIRAVVVNGDGTDFELETAGVFAKRVNISSKLDGAGRVRLELELSDPVAQRISNEDKLLVYTDNTPLAAFYVRDIRVSEDDGGGTLQVSGPDTLDELARVRVPRGTIYENADFYDTVDDLLAFMTAAGYSGWTATSAGGESYTVTARFDGQSVLKCLRKLAGFKGLHIRNEDVTAESGGEVRLSDFAQSGDTLEDLVLIRGDGPHAGINDAALLIESIEVVDDTFDVVNWVEPLGAGNGEAVLTLENSTRTSPYTIEEVTDGRGTSYILKDQDSIDRYGVIQQTRPYRDIGPLSNQSITELEFAANALYDVAAADLERDAEKLTTYSVTVRPGVNTTGLDAIQPGAKILTKYKGTVRRRDGTLTYVDVNEYLWVMDVSQSIGLNGRSFKLKLATVDRVQKDAEEIVVGALESIQLRNVSVETYLSHNTFTYEEEIAPGFSSTLPLYVTNVTRDITRVLLRLRTRPFRSTVTGSAAGGGVATTTAGGGGVATTTAADTGHRHRLTAYAGKAAWANPLEIVYHRFGRVDPSNPTPNTLVMGHNPRPGDSFFTEDLYTFDAGGSHSHNLTLSDHSHNLTLSDHTHDLDYGIFDDSQFPGDISVTVNGQSVPGGPWGSSGSALDVEIDITDQIKASTLRQVHQIVISCANGQGIVQGNLDINEIITSVDMGVA